MGRSFILALLCAAVGASAGPRAVPGSARLGPRLITTLQSAPPRTRARLAEFLAAPTRRQPAFYEAFLAFDRSYRESALQDDSTAARSALAYEEIVAAFAAMADDADASDEVSEKLLFLGPYLPALGELKRTLGAPGFWVESEESLAARRDGMREAAIDLRRRAEIESRHPAYSPDATKIAFAVHRRGLDLHLTQGPYRSPRVEDVVLREFSLEYDPAAFRRSSAVRRALGEKPLRYTGQDLRAIGQGVVLSEPGIQFDLDLGGPILRISRDTGEIRFIAAREAVAALHFLPIFRGWLSDRYDRLRRFAVTGDWSAEAGPAAR